MNNNKKDVFIVKNPKVDHKGGTHVTSEDIVTGMGYSLGDYYPSGSRVPDDYDLKYDEYIKLLTDKKTKKETKIPIDKDEIDKIAKLETQLDCIRYILGSKYLYSKYETIVVICDSILKVLPTVIFASLPLLLLKDVTGEISDCLVVTIYLIMGIVAIISGITRIYARGKLFALEEYHNFANETRKKRNE